MPVIFHNSLIFVSPLNLQAYFFIPRTFYWHCSSTPFVLKSVCIHICLCFDPLIFQVNGSFSRMAIIFRFIYWIFKMKNKLLFSFSSRNVFSLECYSWISLTWLLALRCHLSSQQLYLLQWKSPHWCLVCSLIWLQGSPKPVTVYFSCTMYFILCCHIKLLSKYGYHQAEGKFQN